MIRAVIFDMDGTLYDTEVVYGMAWTDAGLTHEQYLQMIGRSQNVNDAKLAEWGMDPVSVRSKRNAFITQWLGQHGLPVKSGAEKTLQWLKKQGIPAAVATSSPLTVAEKYLVASGFTAYFDKVLSGYMLEHSKPDPDIFLMAAEELGYDPSECMVVEDSYNGVRAGHSAGMLTVMIPDQIPADEEMHALADAVLDSLEQLPAYIEEMNAG